MNTGNLTTKKAPKSPKELGEHGRREWRAIQEPYRIHRDEDPAGWSLVLTVCRTEDRIQAMLQILAVEGYTEVDRFGQKRPHHLLSAIRDAETIKRQALKALDLEEVHPAPPAKLGRPAWSGAANR